jgi:hypothetical protein
MAGHVAMAQRLQAKLRLSEAEQQLLSRKLAWFQALLDRERGKQFLASGEFEAARKALSRANSELPSKKLRLALLGLRAAPRLTRLGMSILQRLRAASDGAGQTKRR